MNFDLLCLAVGLAVGFAAGWLSYRGRQSVRRQLAEEAREAIERDFSSLRIELAKASERIHLQDEAVQAIQSELGQERQFNISLHAELSRERTSRSHLEQKLEQQKSEVLQLQQRLSEEFKILVEQVLEEKSQTLNDRNTSSLNLLLQPISEKLQDFKQRLEEQHSRETHELIVLHNKLSNLESKQLQPSNGASAPPPTPQIKISKDAETQEFKTEEGFVELTPELLESSIFERENSVFDPGHHKAGTPEPADFRSFSNKQQVEIDNFFKRTLGRASKKKAAS